MRKSLELGGLSDFEPRRSTRGDRPAPSEKAASKERDDEGWPSREPLPEAPAQVQLNMRLDRAVSDRFKRLCRDDRRTYNDMLSILMDAFDEGQR